MHGRTTCHMHGGTAKGPITKAGKKRSRQAALKHGGHTKQAKAQHREVMALVKKSKQLIKNFK